MLCVACMTAMVLTSPSDKIGCLIKDFVNVNYIDVGETEVIDRVFNTTYVDSADGREYTSSLLLCGWETVLKCGSEEGSHILAAVYDKTSEVCKGYYTSMDVLLSYGVLSRSSQVIRMIFDSKGYGGSGENESRFTEISLVFDSRNESEGSHKIETKEMFGSPSVAVEKLELVSNTTIMNSKNQLEKYLSYSTMKFMDRSQKVVYNLLFLFCMVYSTHYSAKIYKVHPQKTFIVLSILTRSSSMVLNVLWEYIEGLNASMCFLLSNIVQLVVLVIIIRKRDPNIMHNRIVPLYMLVTLVFFCNLLWFMGVYVMLAYGVYLTACFFVVPRVILMGSRRDWYMSMCVSADLVIVQMYMWSMNSYSIWKINWNDMRQLFMDEVSFWFLCGYIFLIPFVSYGRYLWNERKQKERFNRLTESIIREDSKEQIP